MRLERFAGLGICAWLLPGFVSAAPPPAAPAPVLAPVIIVPGAPGSELIQRETGKRLWPSAGRMIHWDGNDRLALPLDDPEGADVVAGGLLRDVRVAGMKFHVPAYDGLEKRLEELGYRAGDWNSPRGEGEYYYFPFDWRQGVETSGRLFYAALADLYGRMPAGTPRAIVLGHSLGGLVARYALMYGQAGLGESGPLPAITWGGGRFMDSLFLIATPNEGTFTSLWSLEAGVNFFWHYGAFSPHVLFTFPAVFDLIPVQIEPLLDEEGRALPFRLDDPKDWERLGWSVFDAPGTGPGSAAHSARTVVFREHLEKEMARSARLREALARIAPTPNPTTLYAVGGRQEESRRTAVVRQSGGRIRIRFPKPKGTGGDFEGLLFEPGDEIVSLRSALARDEPRDAAGSLDFRLLLAAAGTHQQLLSSAETLRALESVIHGLTPQAGEIAGATAIGAGGKSRRDR